MKKLVGVIIAFFYLLPGCSNSSEEVYFRPASGNAASFINNSRYKFETIEHNNFKIYFSKNSYVSHNLEFVKNKLDSSFKRILSVLAIPFYKYGIHIIVVDSRDEMEELIGMHVKGFASIGNDLAFFVFNKNIRPYFKHEIFHLVSSEIWGRTTSRMLEEGGAVYTDGKCLYEDAISQIASYMYIKNLLLPINSLVENFSETASENDMIAYLQSASIFQFLYEQYGIEKVRRLWLSGFDNFENIFGIKLEQFEQNWLSYVSGIELIIDIKWERLMKEGCG
jgi:hypothetical protein